MDTVYNFIEKVRTAIDLRNLIPQAMMYYLNSNPLVNRYLDLSSVTYELERREDTGTVRFLNITFRPDGLEQLGLPVTLVSSFIGSLDLKLPDSYFTTFASLLFGNDGQALDTALVLDSVTITVQPRDNLDGASIQGGDLASSVSSASRISAADRVAAAMAASEVNKMRRLGVHDTSEGDVLVLKAVEVLTRQMSLRLHQLHVRYVDTRLRPSQPFAVGFVLQDFVAGPLSSILPKSTEQGQSDQEDAQSSACASDMEELFASAAWKGMLTSLLQGALPPRLKSFDRKAAAVRGLGLYIQQLASTTGQQRHPASSGRTLEPLPDELSFVNANLGDTPVTMHDWVLSPLAAAATYTLQNGQLFNEHCPPAQRLSMHIPQVDLRLDQEQLRSACVVAAYLKNYQMHRRYIRCWVPARRVAEALLLDPLRHSPNEAAWQQAAAAAAAATAAASTGSAAGSASEESTGLPRRQRRKHALLHQARRYHGLVAGVFGRTLPAELLGSAGVERRVLSSLPKLSLDGLVSKPLPVSPSSSEAQHLVQWASAMTSFLGAVANLAAESSFGTTFTQTANIGSQVAPSRVADGSSVSSVSSRPPDPVTGSPHIDTGSPQRQTSVRDSQGTGLMRQFSSTGLNARSPGPAPAISSILRRQASVRVIDRALLDELSAANDVSDLMAIALANVQLKLRQVMTARQRWLFCIQGVMHDISFELEGLRRAARSKHFSDKGGGAAAAGADSDTLNDPAPPRKLQDLFVSPVEGVTLGLVDGMWRQNYVAAFKLLYKSYSQLNGILIDSITLPGFSIVEFASCSSSSSSSKFYAEQMTSGSSASMKLCIDVASLQRSTATLTTSKVPPTKAGLPAVCNASVSAFDGQLDVKWVVDVTSQRIDAFKDSEMLWAPVPANATARANAQQIVTFLDRHMGPEYILYFRRLAHNELLLQFYLTQQRARQEAEIRRIAGLMSGCIPCSVGSCTSGAADEVQLGDDDTTTRQSRERMARLAAVPLSTGANIRSLAHGTRAMSSSIPPVHMEGGISPTDEQKRMAELRVRRAINSISEGSDEGTVTFSTLQLHTPSLDKPALLALLHDKHSLAPQVVHSLDKLLPNWRELMQSPGRTPEVLQELNQALRRRSVPTGFAFSLPGPNGSAVYGCVEDVSVCPAPFVVASTASGGDPPASGSIGMQLPVSCAARALFAPYDNSLERSVSMSLQQAVLVFHCRMHEGEPPPGQQDTGELNTVPTPHSREHRGILPGGEVYGASFGPRDALGWMAECVLALEAHCFDPMLRARLSRCMLCPTQALEALQTKIRSNGQPIPLQHVSFGHFREESRSTAKSVALSSVDLGVPAEHVHGAPCMLRSSDKVHLSKLVKVSSLDNAALLDVDDQSLPWSYSLRNASIAADGLRVSLVESSNSRTTCSPAMAKLHQLRATDLSVPSGAFFCLEIQQVCLQLHQLKAEHTRAMLRVARMRVLQDQKSLVESADASFFDSVGLASESGTAGGSALPTDFNPFGQRREIEPSIAHGPLMTTLDLSGRASDYFVQQQPTAEWATHSGYLHSLSAWTIPATSGSPDAQIQATMQVLTSNQLGLSVDAATAILCSWVDQSFTGHTAFSRLQQALTSDEGATGRTAGTSCTAMTPMRAFCVAAATKVLMTTPPPEHLLSIALGMAGESVGQAPAASLDGDKMGSLSSWVRSIAETAWSSAASRFYLLCPSPLQLLHDDEHSNLLDCFAKSGLLPTHRSVAVQQALAAWRAALMFMQGTVWAPDKMRPVSLASKEQALSVWRAWLTNALGVDSRIDIVEAAEPQTSSWWRTGNTEQRHSTAVNTSVLTDLGMYLVHEHHAKALIIKAADTRMDSRQFAHSVDAAGHAGGKQLAQAICEVNSELLSMLEGVLLHELVPHFVNSCWDPRTSMLRPVVSHLARGSRSNGTSSSKPSFELQHFQFRVIRAAARHDTLSSASGRPLSSVARRGVEELVSGLQPYDPYICPALEVFLEKSPMPLPAVAFADARMRLFADNPELTIQQCIATIALIKEQSTVDEVHAECELCRTGSDLPVGAASHGEHGEHAEKCLVAVHVGQQQIAAESPGLEFNNLRSFLQPTAGRCLIAWHRSFAESDQGSNGPLSAALPSVLRACILSVASGALEVPTKVLLLSVGCADSTCSVISTRTLQFEGAETARGLALLQLKLGMQAFIQIQNQGQGVQSHTPKIGAMADCVEFEECSGTWSGDLGRNLATETSFAAEHNGLHEAAPDSLYREPIQVEHEGFVHSIGKQALQHPESLCDALRDGSTVAQFKTRRAQISRARCTSKHSIGRPFTKLEGGFGSLTLSVHPATIGSYLGIFLRMRPFLAAAYIGQLSLLPGSQADKSSLGSSLQLIKRTRQLRRLYQRSIRSLASARHSASSGPVRPSRESTQLQPTTHDEADEDSLESSSLTSTILINCKASHVSILLPLSCVRGENEGLVSFLPIAPMAGYAFSSAANESQLSLPTLQLLQLDLFDLCATSGQDLLSESDRGQLLTLGHMNASSKRFTDKTAFMYFQDNVSDAGLASTTVCLPDRAQVPLCANDGVLISSSKLFDMQGLTSFFCTQRNKLKRTLTRIDGLDVNISSGGVLDLAQVLAEWGSLLRFVRFVDETSQLLQDNSNEDKTAAVKVLPPQLCTNDTAALVQVVDHSFSLERLQVHLGQPGTGALRCEPGTTPVEGSTPNSNYSGQSNAALLTLDLRSLHLAVQTQATPCANELPQVNAYSLHPALKPIYMTQSTSLVQCSLRVGAVLLCQGSEPATSAQCPAPVDINTSNCVSPVLSPRTMRYILVLHSPSESEPCIKFHCVGSNTLSSSASSAHSVAQHDTKAAIPKEANGHSRRASHVPHLQGRDALPTSDDATENVQALTEQSEVSVETRPVNAQMLRKDILLLADFAAISAQVGTDSIAIFTSLQQQVDAVKSAIQALQADPEDRFVLMREWVNGKFLAEDEGTVHSSAEAGSAEVGILQDTPVSLVPVALGGVLLSAHVRIGSLYSSLQHNSHPLVTTRIKKITLRARRAETTEASVAISRAQHEAWWSLPQLISLQATARSLTAFNGTPRRGALAFPSIRDYSQATVKLGAAVDSVELILGRPEVFVLAWHEAQHPSSRPDPLRRSGQWLPTALPAGALASASPFCGPAISCIKKASNDAIWSALVDLENSMEADMDARAAWWSGVPHGVAKIQLNGMGGSGTLRTNTKIQIEDMFSFVRPVAESVQALRIVHAQACKAAKATKHRPLQRPIVQSTFEACFGDLHVNVEQDISILPWDVASACYESDAIAPSVSTPQDKPHGFAWMFGRSPHKQFVIPVLSITTGADMAAFLGQQAHASQTGAPHEDCRIPFRIQAVEISSHTDGIEKDRLTQGQDRALLRNLCIQTLHMRVNSDPTAVRMLAHTAKLLSEFVQAAQGLLSPHKDSRMPHDAWVALLLQDSARSVQLEACLVASSGPGSTSPSGSASVLDADDDMSTFSAASTVENSVDESEGAENEHPVAAEANTSSMAVTLQMETMVADFDVLASGVQRFWGAPPPASVMKVAQDIHAELQRGGTDTSGDGSPYAQDALKEFPSLPRNYRWSPAASTNRLEWLQQVARGAVVPHCQMVQYAVSLGVCLDPRQMHEMWLTSAESERAQLQLNELHVSSGALFLAYVAPSPVLANVRGVPEPGRQLGFAGLPCVWPSHQTETASSYSGGVRADPLRGAPLSAAWASPSGLERPASAPSPTRYVVYPQWWLPGALLPQHIYSYNAAPWYASAFASILPFRHWASNWLRHSLDSTTDEVLPVQASELSVTDRQIISRVFKDRVYQLHASMCRFAGLPELSELLAVDTADAIREIASGQRHSVDAAPMQESEDSPSKHNNHFGIGESVCESAFLGVSIAGHTRSVFTDPPEAAQLHTPATSTAVAYPLSSWVSAHYVHPSVEASTASAGLACPLSCFPLLPNTLHLTMVLPIDPYSSNLLQPSKIHNENTHVFPPRSAEWVVEWTAHVQNRLGEHGGYGPLWVWCQEASARHSAPSQHGVPNWSTPEVVHTEDVSDVMHHMAELRSGPKEARLLASPLCKGDPRETVHPCT